MKVNDCSTNSVTIGTGPAGRTESVKGDRSGSSSVQDSSSQDQISISDLGSLVRSVSGDTLERSQRISQLTAMYKSGSYTPDSAATSRSVVEDALGTV